MKTIWLIFLLGLFCSDDTKAQSNIMNVYLANGDSIYYCEGSTFNVEKLHGSKEKDPSFLNNIISIVKEKKSKVLFKPMDSFGTGAVADDIQKVCTFFIKNNIPYKMSETDSLENKYFNGISMLEYIRTHKKEEKKPAEIPGLQRPPMPPPPGLEELDEDALITFVLSNNNTIFYYKGFFNYKFLTTDFNEVGKIISTFKNTTKKRDQFIIYKKTKLATTKNVTDFINKIKSSGIASGHYREFKLEYIEMRYLNQ